MEFVKMKCKLGNEECLLWDHFLSWLVETDHEIISMVILSVLLQEGRLSVTGKVCAQALLNHLYKPAQEKAWVVWPDQHDHNSVEGAIKLQLKTKSISSSLLTLKAPNL